MMSPENIPAKTVTDDDKPSQGGRKAALLRPPEQPMKCPRCDSPNTKFCYYNNYSLTQPRHFCKTCRRYWTKGGALRNIPIGGGCRKNKKTKSSSRFSGDSKDSASSSSETSGLKLFNGFMPSMNFQLGGLPFTRLHSSTSNLHNNQFASNNPSGFEGSLMRFNGGFNGGGFEEMNSLNVNSNLASSIESLSCINQDLHWKLQQQRLSMLFGGENQRESSVVSSVPALMENQAQQSQQISFQNLEIQKPDVSVVDDNNNPRKREWFLENSYIPSTTTTTTNYSCSNGNDNTSDWNGIQAWADLHQYNALP